MYFSINSDKSINFITFLMDMHKIIRKLQPGPQMIWAIVLFGMAASPKEILAMNPWRTCATLPVCRFGCIFKFFKVLLNFISFNLFLHCSNSFYRFKCIFEPIHRELDQVSTQLVDSRPES